MPELKLLLVSNLVLTAFLTGLVWFVQVVHYPGFQHIGSDQFVDYHHFHTSATGKVVILPMLLELAIAVWLLGTPAHQGWIWANLSGVLLVWLITFFWIVPVHNQLAGGLDLAQAKQLVWLNGWRTLFWTGKCIAAVVLIIKT